MLRGSATIFSYRLAGAVFTFVLQLVLARWMGAAELGIYVVAFSWCILLAVIGQMGLASAAIRLVGYSLAQNRPGLARGFVRRGATIVTGSAATIGILLVAVTIALQSSLPGQGVAPFLVAAISIPFHALINFQSGVCSAFSWFNLAFLPSNLIRPLLTLLIVTLLWLAIGNLSATVVLSVQLGVMVVITFSLVHILKPRVNRATRKEAPEYDTSTWIRTGLPLVIVKLFTVYYPEFTLIMLGLYLPSDEIAIFNVGYRVAMLIGFGIFAVDAFAMPSASLSCAAGDQQALRDIVARAAQVRFWASVAAAALLLVIGRWFLSIFGEEFVAGYAVMVILVAAQLVSAAFGPVTALLSATGNQDRLLVVFATTLAGATILLNLLVPAYGTIGAAAATLLVTFGWCFWLHHLVVKLLGIPPDVLSGLRMQKAPDDERTPPDRQQ